MKQEFLLVALRIPDDPSIWDDNDWNFWGSTCVVIISDVGDIKDIAVHSRKGATKQVIIRDHQEALKVSRMCVENDPWFAPKDADYCNIIVPMTMEQIEQLEVTGNIILPK